MIQCHDANISILKNYFIEDLWMSDGKTLQVPTTF